MKNLIIWTIVVFISIKGFTQDTIPSMELNPNGFVGVVDESIHPYIILEFPEKSKDELYKASLTYLFGIYNNPKDVISSVENESIIVNGLTMDIQGELEIYKYELHYSIKMMFKDGKIRFEPHIIQLIEEWPHLNRKHNVYVASTDSPKKVEINCIWVFTKSKNKFVLLNPILKTSIENWTNSYIKNLVAGIQQDDW